MKKSLILIALGLFSRRTLQRKLRQHKCSPCGQQSRSADRKTASMRVDEQL